MDGGDSRGSAAAQHASLGSDQGLRRFSQRSGADAGRVRIDRPLERRGRSGRRACRSAADAEVRRSADSRFDAGRNRCLRRSPIDAAFYVRRPGSAPSPCESLVPDGGRAAGRQHPAAAVAPELQTGIRASVHLAERSGTAGAYGDPRYPGGRERGVVAACAGTACPGGGRSQRAHKPVELICPSFYPSSLPHPRS